MLKVDRTKSCWWRNALSPKLDTPATASTTKHGDQPPNKAVSPCQDPPPNMLGFSLLSLKPRSRSASPTLLEIICMDPNRCQNGNIGMGSRPLPMNSASRLVSAKFIFTLSHFTLTDITALGQTRRFNPPQQRWQQCNR